MHFRLMRNIIVLISVNLFTVGTITAEPLPDRRAAAWLKKLTTETQAYQRRSPQTRIFSRAQLKYGLERDDYLHFWFDRPLLQDSSLPKTDGFINPYSYRIIRDVVKNWGMDGLAFFPTTQGRSKIYKYSVKPGEEMLVMPELIGGGSGKLSGVKYHNYNKQIKLAGAALKCSSGFRLGDKLVLTSYPADDNIEYWSGLKAALREKLGDKFILMPFHRFLPYNMTYKSELTVKDIEFLLERTRTWLRAVDGYYYNSPATHNRRYQAAFDRQVVIPVLHRVLSEPEFKNKYLAWGTKVGHEDYHNKGSYSMDCAGTGFLRGSFGSAVNAQADIVNCVEWDEQNENTSFRPTLCNSFSTQRIVRYYAAIANQRQLTPVAMDNLEIPNLILSYRRVLVAGQLLEFEVVNIPDNSAQVKEYQVELVLKNLSGKVVKRFTGNMATDKLSELRFNVPAAELLENHLLIPELSVTAADKSYIVSNGFYPVELRPRWNFDYKWIKQPLRDMSRGIVADLKIIKHHPDNWLELKGKIISPQQLRSIDLLESGDVVYSHQTDSQQPRENNDQVVIEVNYKSIPGAGAELAGELSFQPGPVRTYAANPLGKVEVVDNTWRFSHGNIKGKYSLLEMVACFDRQTAGQSVIDIKLPGLYEGQIKVSELIEKGIYAIAGDAGSNLVFRNASIQRKIPPPLNKNQAEFTVFVRPAFKQAVYYLEIIDENYKVYRSAPVTIFRPAGKTAKFSIYDTAKNRATVAKADINAFISQEYDFSPQFGSAIRCGAGEALTGISGGFAPQATGGKALGESKYGNPMVRYWESQRIKGYGRLAPVHFNEPDGSWSLQFDGRQHVSFPVGTLPTFAGFELELEVYPDKVSGVQPLFSTGRHGFRLVLEKDVPTALFFRGNVLLDNSDKGLAEAVGPKLRARQWNTIKVIFNNQNLVVETNGKRGEAGKCAGYQLYPEAATLGADAGMKAFFTGKLRNLKIKPYFVK